MVKVVKHPVTMRALQQRIHRALAKQGLTLVGTRGRVADAEIRYYYIVDENQQIKRPPIGDLELLAEELGVLKAYETVVQKE